MRPTTKRTYTAKQREDALGLSAKVGSARAAARLGMPKGTIDSWEHMVRKRSRAGASEVDGGAVVEPSPEVGEQASSGGTERRKRGRPRKTPRVQAPPQPVAVPPSKVDGRAPQATAPVKSKRTLIARTHLPSARAQALELAEKVGITEAARQLGISRFSIYDWRRKTRLAAQDTTHVSPLVGEDVDPGLARDARILEEWRAHPGLGPSQIRNQLRRAGMKVSVHTVRVVLDANGYVTPRTKRTEVHDRRYEAVRPNQLWHADFLSRYINKQLIRVLFFIDDYSRFIVGWNIFDEERASAVIETF